MTEQQAELMGRTWMSPDGSRRRIYFPEALLAEVLGFTYTVYKTGNIQSATLKGEKVSNGKADAFRQTLRRAQVYYDCHAQALQVEHLEPAVAAVLIAGLEHRGEAS